MGQELAIAVRTGGNKDPVAQSDPPRLLLGFRASHTIKLGNYRQWCGQAEWASVRVGRDGVRLTPRTSAVSSSRFCAFSGTDSSVPTGSFFCRGRKKKPQEG